ncbi:MAG: Ig-like domain-containing protein [Planctomycetota bacterium]|nr:Ig-like domain-containing protein [Planctomycetota bacterium]
MTRNAPSPTPYPILVFLAVLTSLVFVMACTDNAGGLFGCGGSGGGGGGGGGGTLPGPAVPPIDGAIKSDSTLRATHMLPASGSVAMDVKTPIAVWFSESINLSTVTSTSLAVRPEGSTGSVAWSILGFSGDRGIVLAPVSDLSVDTKYEVVATEDITDLDGERLNSGVTGLLGTFTTASSSSGIAPQTLGSFPPSGSENQPNTYSAILVFSKPIDYLGVSAATTWKADGTSVNAGTPVGYFPPSGSPDAYRVVEFSHLSSESDLGVTMTLDVADTIMDIEFTPQSLQAPLSVSWTTLNFGAPSALDIFGEPAVNLANISIFPTEATLPATSLAGDTVELEIWETWGGNSVDNTMTSSANGPTTVLYFTDLTDPFEAGAPILSDGPLYLAAYIERSGLRSAILVTSEFHQDTNPPSLREFGPPSDSSPSRFRTDLPEIRPYGYATEPIQAVDIGGDVRTGTGSSTASFFIGHAFDPGPPDGTETLFDYTLTDLANNPMESSMQGRAIRRGFVGMDAALGMVTVECFNKRSLTPISGATVYIQNADGGSLLEDHGSTGSGGTFIFDDSAMPGARSGAQTITIVHPSFHAVTLVGVDASLVSLPLREKSAPTETLSLTVAGQTTGLVRVASPLLGETITQPEPDFMLDYDLEQSFNSLTVLPDRPGWFSGFYEVADHAGGGAQTYFNQYAIEPRVLVDAPDSSSSSLAFPILGLLPSTNSALPGAEEYLFEVQSMVPGGGFSGLTERTAMTLSPLPGLPGPAITGVGGLSGLNASVEMESVLQTLAEAEGATAAKTLFQVYAEDGDGDRILARTSIDVVSNPPPLASMTLPGVPAPLAPTGTTWPNITLNFTDVLAGEGDWNRLILVDDSLSPTEWDLWVPSDSDSAADSVILPTLALTSSSASEDPPLSFGSGISWTLQVEAFDMPDAVFTGPEGIFFAQLPRDCMGWALTIPSNGFEVQ